MGETDRVRNPVVQEPEADAKRAQEPEADVKRAQEPEKPGNGAKRRSKPEDEGKKLQELEAAVEKAMEDGGLRIEYRPVIDIQSSCLDHAIVQIIWESEDGTVRDQERFMPQIAHCSVVRRVDEYIFEEACKAIADFRVEDRLTTRLSVRFSALSLFEDGLGERLCAVMERYEVTMADLELAISDHSFEREGERLAESMQRLKDMGFFLAVCGLGTDFSCFRYLRKLPVSTLRFDSEYLRDHMRDDRGRQIIRGLVRLGRELGFGIVAEGVENQEELEFLGGCGCAAASGSCCSEYLRKAEFVAYVRERLRGHGSSCSYRFFRRLESEEASLCGEMVGDVRYTEGISERWGGLYFPGGDAGRNIVKLPRSMMPEGSFTVSFWMRPVSAWNWASVFYVGYMSGFFSLIPLADKDNSVFRVYEDGNPNGWHDITCRMPELDRWTMLTVTYDALSGFTGYYINGVKEGHKVDAPVMDNCLDVILGGDPSHKSFKGAVSGLIVFDRAYMEQEVMRLYQTFRLEPGFCGPD